MDGCQCVVGSYFRLIAVTVALRTRSPGGACVSVEFGIRFGPVFGLRIRHCDFVPDRGPGAARRRRQAFRVDVDTLEYTF
eukprot:7391854-Prymnesium_polylepis.1